MARYRQFLCAFWDDPDVENYTSNQKLVHVYSFTSPNTTASGIYPLTVKKIANSTGIKVNIIETIFRKKQLKNIYYDWNKKVIFVAKFLKYNYRGNPEKIKKSVIGDMRTIHTVLWRKFQEEYPVYFEKIMEENKILYDSLQLLFQTITGDEDNIGVGAEVGNKDIHIFLDYFNEKINTKYPLTPERKGIIARRLKNHSLDQLKKAVDNFSKDEWADRPKFLDIVYCIGIRNKIDNLERWLNPVSLKSEIKPPYHP